MTNRQATLWLGALTLVLLIIIILISVSLGYIAIDIGLGFSILLISLTFFFSWENVFYHSWKKNMIKLYGKEFNEYEHTFLPLFRRNDRIHKGNILFKNRESLILSIFIIYENGILAKFDYKNNNSFCKEFKFFNEIYAIYPGQIESPFKYFALRIETTDLKVCIIPLPFHLDKIIIPLFEKGFGKRWNDIYKNDETANLFGDHSLLGKKSTGI